MLFGTADIDGIGLQCWMWDAMEQLLCLMYIFIGITEEVPLRYGILKNFFLALLNIIYVDWWMYELE